MRWLVCCLLKIVWRVIYARRLYLSGLLWVDCKTKWLPIPVFIHWSGECLPPTLYVRFAHNEWCNLVPVSNYFFMSGVYNLIVTQWVFSSIRFCLLFKYIKRLDNESIKYPADEESKSTNPGKLLGWWIFWYILSRRILLHIFFAVKTTLSRRMPRVILIFIKLSQIR